MRIQLSSSKPDIEEICKKCKNNATLLTILSENSLHKMCIIYVNMKLVYYYFKINCKYFCNLSVIISNAVNIFIGFMNKQKVFEDLYIFFSELKGVLSQNILKSLVCDTERIRDTITKLYSVK